MPLSDQTPSKSALTLRAWLAIAGLGLTAFTFVTVSLMPIGLLPDIADTFGRTEARTGQLVTVYAWVVALLTLPLTLLTSGFNRRPLMLTLLLIFILSQLLSAWAPSYDFLILSRIITAAAHAVLWGLSAPSAVRLAPEGWRAQALAAVAAGISLSTVLGVPLATLAGQAWGWRSAFLMVGLWSLILLSALFIFLPSLPGDKSRPLANLAVIIKRPALWRIYFVLMATLCGHAAAFTYFTPFMRGLGGWSPPAVVHLFLLFGLSGVVGGFLGGAAARQPGRAVVAALIILALNLALARHLAGPALIGTIAFCFLWGAMLSGVGVLYQTLLFQAAPEATDLAMSIYAIFFNLGIGGGAFIGGFLFEKFSVNATAVGGAALIGLALFIFLGTRGDCPPNAAAAEKKR